MRRLLLVATLLLTACPAKPEDTAGSPEVDLDGDGFPSAEDCDDEDAAVFPGAVERCNGYDDDCDGYVDDEDPSVEGAPLYQLDADSDGWGSMDPDEQAGFCEDPGSGWVEDATDCDDGDPDVHPEAQEYCNQLDDDCDGEIDEDGALDSLWYLDGDGDGYGDPDLALEQCEQPSGYVLESDDCDDGDAAVYPGADERCNGYDDDCDGVVDEDDAVDGATWYADADGDGYGDASSTTTACSQPSGYTTDATDCDDAWAVSYPGADELCDGMDNDCDGTVDEEVVDGTTWYLDADGDGYGDSSSSSTTTTCEQPTGYVASDTDCDDTDASVNPWVDERCNGVDDDCDGTVDEDSAVDATIWYADVDSDGFGDSATGAASCAQPTGWVADGTDCDDLDTAANPGASERCDGVDNDCDGTVDEADALDAATWYADADGDSFGDPAATTAACSSPSGYVADDSDCDDSDAAINPVALESCDGADNDCDGTVDEADAVDAATWYADADGDSFGNSSITTAACSQPSGYVADDTDCNDGASGQYPGADEYCDGADNDCDGTVDEADALDAVTWYTDADGDGYGDSASSTVSCSAPIRTSAVGGDCDDSDVYVNPGASERCDGVDNDCDGVVDDSPVDAGTWYADADGDSYGDGAVSTVACSQPSGYAVNARDCDDSDAGVHPLADEYCNGVDDDCDGTVDEDSAVDVSTWYLDSDVDGYGRSSFTASSCSAPSGFVADATDCNDSDATVHPGADEYCDIVDHDCDGSTTAGAVDASLWFTDGDGDGYGDGGSATLACSPPAGTVGLDSDCDDTDADIHPGATEWCNGVDDDCDGAVDGSGLATWIDSSGAMIDLTGAMAAGTSSSAYTRSFTVDGALVLCDGTYYTHLQVRAADFTLTGLDGSGSTTIQGDGSAAVVTAYNTTSTVLIEGVTIRDGSSTYGGGIYGGTHGLDLELDDVVVEDCYASSQGGGVYHYGGVLTATDLVLDGNQAGSYGGGLCAYSTDVYIDGLVATDNTSASYGGGLYLRDGDVEVFDATIQANVAYYAGGLMAHTCDLSLSDSEVSDNEAYTYGGGVYLTHGEAILDEVQVHGNAVTYGSYGYYAVGGGLFLNNGVDVTCFGSSSTTAGVYDNESDYGGGAFLYDEDSTLVSDICDWGSGSSDNDPDDVALAESWARYSSYGADASFTCHDSSCY